MFVLFAVHMRDLVTIAVTVVVWNWSVRDVSNLELKVNQRIPPTLLCTAAYLMGISLQLQSKVLGNGRFLPSAL